MLNNKCKARGAVISNFKMCHKWCDQNGMAEVNALHLQALAFHVVPGRQANPPPHSASMTCEC